MPKEIQITHGLKEGELVFVDDVPNGKQCNCTCTKCGEPLQAKNKGIIKQHHFAHIADTDCKGETVYHIEAKKQIYNDGFLILPIVKRDQSVIHSLNNYNPYVVPVNTDFDKSKSRSDTYETIEDIYMPEKVKFEKIEVEKRIGNSKFIADLICADKDGKELIVEIAYKHFLSKAKKKYLIDNKIKTVEININYWINVRSKNEAKEPLSEYMSSDFFESISRWIYNENAKRERKAGTGIIFRKQ